MYVAFPSLAGAAKYRILFARRPRLGGPWSAAVPVTDGVYDAIRPDLYLDSSNGWLHLVASSFENAQNLYYSASGSQGATWDVQSQFDPNDPDYPECEGNTRYATIHASGTGSSGGNIYIATRTKKASTTTLRGR